MSGPFGSFLEGPGRRAVRNTDCNGFLGPDRLVSTLHRRVDPGPETGRTLHRKLHRPPYCRVDLGRETGWSTPHRTLHRTLHVEWILAVHHTVHCAVESLRLAPGGFKIFTTQ